MVFLSERDLHPPAGTKGRTTYFSRLMTGIFHVFPSSSIVPQLLDCLQVCVQQVVRDTAEAYEAAQAEDDATQGDEDKRIEDASV